MTLQPPRLDDRAYADLRAELIRRIPVHAPEWTDRGAGDPGITLIELFSFLGDNLLYRLNRVPEAARLAFLNLLSIPPRPAVPAHVQVRLTLPRGGADPVTPAFSPVDPRLTVSAGEIGFELAEELTVLPLELRAYRKLPQTLAGVTGTEGVAQLLADHLGATPGLSPYRAEPMPLPEGGVLPPSASTASAVDGALWLCLLGTEDALKVLDTAGPVIALQRLRRRIAGFTLNLGVRTDDALCGASDHWRCPDPGSEPTRFPLVWDVSTGGFIGTTRRVDRAKYLRLSLSSDNTSGLTRSGTVRLRLPPVAGDGSVPFGDWTADSFDPPDPDLLGVADLPPRLDDPKLAARVIAWIRVRRADPDDPPIALRHIEANTARAIQAVTAGAEMLAHGDGRAGQTARLSRTPVLAGSETVQVRGPTGWETWTSTDDLALAGPDDPAYRLDPASGTVTFGDGIHGRIPLPGEAIRVLSYQVGGGARGNLGAGALTRVSGPPEAAGMTATNALPAEGGRDGESDAEATARIPRLLRARDRAVCTEDFAAIALEVPDVHVGRAQVLPRHMPFQRSDGIPGVVTLIVLPAYDPVTPDTPTPDREMLRRVCAYLEPRRLVTTELYVTPPEYCPVDLSIAVEAEAGTGEETLRRNVELGVRQYFAPLPPYGPSGEGWSFGRVVRDRDVEAACLRIAGVRLVNAVVLQGTAIAPDGETTAVTETLPLRAWQLPHVREVRVAIGPTPDPFGDPPPLPGGMPVPVEKEEC